MFFKILFFMKLLETISGLKGYIIDFPVDFA